MPRWAFGGLFEKYAQKSVFYSGNFARLQPSQSDIDRFSIDSRLIGLEIARFRWPHMSLLKNDKSPKISHI